MTGYCAGECVDPTKCGGSGTACEYTPIRSAADFLAYTNCTQVCSLTLDNLPDYDIRLFDAFNNLKRVIGHLVVSNNKYLTTLAFFSSLEFVCAHMNGCLLH